MKQLSQYLLLIFLAACGSSEVQEKVATNISTNEPTPITICTQPPTADTLWYSQNKKAPLLTGLEGINIKITTNSPEAQKYFNQGMMLAYGFNHAEAARSFYEATRQDPNCAMCYWGYAYVLGPNYNAGMEPDNYSRAYKAVQQAKNLSGKVSPKERALILALDKRYSPDVVEDRSSLDKAYADALKKVYSQYPDDADIGAMYAEALMDMHPWNLWQKDGKPQPWTNEILATLLQIMQVAPKHAGAHHFYIHATEASTNPGVANSSAKILETLVPGAGHLVHMPSHTYIRTGNYHAGTLANLRAVKADSIYTTTCHAQGAYPLGYYPHNYHFIAATATLEGNRKLAMMAARKVADHVHPKVMNQPGWETLQHYYTIPYNVAVKFGMWDEVLSMKNLDTDLIYPDAIMHYAHGMAYTGKDNLPRAKAELAKLKALSRKPELKEMTIWGINSMQDITEIAHRVLEASILAKEEKHIESIKLLREAVAIEDNLNYNEPPDWFFSVRHHLGVALLQTKQYKEAINVYEQDLQKMPNNGWALNGLLVAYKGMGNNSKAQQVQNQFDDAWQWADTKLVASRVE